MRGRLTNVLLLLLCISTSGISGVPLKSPPPPITAMAQVSEELVDYGLAEAPPDEQFMGRLVGWLEECPTLLFFIGVVSVTVMCVFSQLLVRFSKQSNISLNKYYKRRGEDKQKQMELICERGRVLSQARARRQREEDLD